MKPLHKVVCQWTPAFAYVIGLIATDGCLSSDGRHMEFNSKDRELVCIFKKILGLQNKISRKARGGEVEKKYYRIQFGDVTFYHFLLDIGLTPHKSKTIGSIKIPHQYFFDFLRGCIDGDGTIYEFRHPESRHPQLRVRLASASTIFLEWILNCTRRNGIKGGYIRGVARASILEYAIADSLRLLHLMYYPGFEFCLRRKYLRARGHLVKPR